MEYQKIEGSQRPFKWGKVLWKCFASRSYRFNNQNTVFCNTVHFLFFLGNQATWFRCFRVILFLGCQKNAHKTATNDHRVPTSAIDSLTNVELCLPQELEAPGVLVGTVVGLLLHCPVSDGENASSQEFQEELCFFVHTIHILYTCTFILYYICIHIFNIYIYI